MIQAVDPREHMPALRAQGVFGPDLGQLIVNGREVGREVLGMLLHRERFVSIDEEEGLAFLLVHVPVVTPRGSLVESGGIKIGPGFVRGGSIIGCALVVSRCGWWAWLSMWRLASGGRMRGTGGGLGLAAGWWRGSCGIG